MYRFITRSRICAWILLNLLASGCFGNRTPTFKPGQTLPATVAVLPSTYAGDIPRDRVDLVRNAIVRELRNKNFIVVEDRVITSACSSPACPEREQLAKSYLIDGFVTVEISSFSRNNLLLGYYNQLEGSLSVASPSGAQLARATYTESESGGILLQSGQVIQGIISQVEHSGSKVFDNLADRFARNIVERLPPPRAATSSLATEGVALALKSVSAKWTPPSAFSVCASGTPHSFAYLVLGATQTSLRETAPGTYCGTFSPLVAPREGTSEFVELRTAFGNSLRKDIQLPTTPPCDLSKRAVVEGTSEVTVKCVEIGDHASEGCSSSIPTCKAEKIVLYEAPHEGGAYTKVAEARVPRLRNQPHGGVAALIAISPGGITSQPIQIPQGR